LIEKGRAGHPPNLKSTILQGTDLTGARLYAADPSEADLSGANLSAADLLMADLKRADLRRANLANANLNWTNFRETNLAETDFTGATVVATNFAALDLSVATGLETVKHRGPSTVGIDTIYKSHGKIPEVFLRGCGVPDEFIAYIGSIVGRPIEYYSCFISYSTRDQEFAERLHADLQAKGVRCWFAPHDIQGGRKIHEQIDEAIRLYDRLLLMLHPSERKSGVRRGPRPCRRRA
jgi:TIR domain/Pentapeptide repeats (8 copies)